MAAISRSVVALRVFGEDLIPDELTVTLGASPTASYKKGDTALLPGGRTLTRKTGMWVLEARGDCPDCLESQITRVFSCLVKDLSVWRGLTLRFKVDLFCGIFMEVSDEGFELSPAITGLLSERGIAIGACIYAPDTGPPRLEDSCPCESGQRYGDCCAPGALAEPPPAANSRERPASNPTTTAGGG